MSMFHKGYRGARRTYSDPWRFIALLFCASFANAQLSIDDITALNARQKDGADPHEIAVALSGVERLLREGSEDVKLSGALQAIALATLIYRTHDTRVPTDGSVGRLPDFDATKLGGKPIFLGADPNSIADPKIRMAYKEALERHEQLSTRVEAELHKLEEGDYCARVAFRVIESSENPAALREKIEAHIASIKDAQWIRDRLTQVVLPKPQPKEQSQPQDEPSGSQATSQPQSGAATPPLQTVHSAAPKKALSTSPTPIPSAEPTSSTPWSIIVVLIVAAIGLLWLLVKKRK